MTTKINQILQDNEINPGNTKFALGYTELYHFAQQVIGESILAALCAPTKNLETTTYDHQLVEATRTKIIDAIRDHFK
jgi:hypothetical protein